MNEVKSELVIIRRRSAFDDEKPHGGVWKIAYADFMTAMMAFFLVMWLINALNQDQKQVVASYFNPIKLAENAPAPKGLKDLSKKEPSSFDGQDGRRQPARTERGTSRRLSDGREAALLRGEGPVPRSLYDTRRDRQQREPGLGPAARRRSDVRRRGWPQGRRRLPRSVRSRLLEACAAGSQGCRSHHRAQARAQAECVRARHCVRHRPGRAASTPSQAGRCRRKRGSERRCVVRKPVAPAAAGPRAVAVFTRRERAAGCPGW